MAATRLVGAMVTAAFNGFILATRPYIPSVVGGDINALETGLKERAPQVRVIEVSRATSPQFGPIRVRSERPFLPTKTADQWPSSLQRCTQTW